MARGCTVVRVFTRGQDGGNYLGVVTDCTGLDDTMMQQIATDLGYSETVFVDWTPGAPPFVRIFTPASELPFAGHPLVGAAWVLTVLGPGDMDRIRYQEGVALISTTGAITQVEVAMDGEVAPAGDVLEFLKRANIGPVDGAERIMIPKEYVLAKLPDAESVAALEPDMSVLAERFGTLAYARVGNHVRARFFAPGTAVPEDPATGSAAVALATKLAAAGETAGQLTIDQGEETGFPSRIQLAWSNGRATIGGTVVHDEIKMLEM